MLKSKEAEFHIPTPTGRPRKLPKGAEEATSYQTKFCAQLHKGSYVVCLLAVVSATAIIAADAQTSSVLQQLSNEFKMAPRTVDGKILVTQGTALVVQKEGMLAIPRGTASIPSSTYKDGELHPPGKALRFMGSVEGIQQFERIPVGARVYLVNIEVNIKKDYIMFVVFQCEPCDDDPTHPLWRAGLAFQFPKGYLSTAEPQKIQEVIRQVFSVDTIQQTATNTNLAVGHAPASPPPILGPVYVNPQNSDDRLQLNPDGSFVLREGGQSYSGTHVLQGNILKLHIIQLSKDANVTVEDNNLIVNGNETWVQPEQRASGTPVSMAHSPIVSTFVSNDDPNDVLVLRQDKTFSLSEQGKQFAGTYEWAGEQLTLTVGGRPVVGRLNGEMLTDPRGKLWTRKGTLVAPRSESLVELLGNGDVIKLVQAKLQDAIIIGKIKSSACRFDLSTDALIKLKEANVSDAVIQAMVEASRK